MSFRKIQAVNLSTAETSFDDPLIILNKSGTITDIGFLGKRGINQYAGLVRDSETNEFMLLDSITLSSATVNDVSALDASIVKGNITVGTITADTIVSNSIPADLSDLTDTGGLLGGSVDLSAVAQHIIPSQDVTYDLGSVDYKWRDLYLSGNTIHLGDDTKIKVTPDGDMSVTDTAGVSKSMRVKEIELDNGSGKKIRLQQESNGRLKMQKVDKVTGHVDEEIDADFNKDDLSVSTGSPTLGGALTYDSATGVFTYQSSTINTYATKVGYNLADETDIKSIVLTPGDANTPATYRGDVVDNSGNVIVDVSSTSTTFTGGLAGNV